MSLKYKVKYLFFRYKNNYGFQIYNIRDQFRHLPQFKIVWLNDNEFNIIVLKNEERKKEKVVKYEIIKNKKLDIGNFKIATTGKNILLFIDTNHEYIINNVLSEEGRQMKQSFYNINNIINNNIEIRWVMTVNDDYRMLLLKYNSSNIKIANDYKFDECTRENIEFVLECKILNEYNDFLEYGIRIFKIYYDNGEYLQIFLNKT
jgi:hypothetical protein